MAVCRSCGKKAALVKSHVIPEAFFRQIREGEEAPLLVTSVRGQFPKRAPIGVYDSNILCAECEKQLGLVDSYGINVLINEFDKHFTPLSKDGKVVGFESDAVDKVLLLRFFIAVIWRASLSQIPFYQHVSLGMHESAARDISLLNHKCDYGAFDVVLSKWKYEAAQLALSATILNPRRERWSGINAYRLYLGEIIAYVKVDARPFPASLISLSLRENDRVRLVARVLESSKDFAALTHTAQISHLNQQAFRAARAKSR